MFKTNKTLIALALSATLIGCGQKTASEHIELAKSHLAKQDINSAIIEYKNAISLEPNNPRIRLNIAQAYFDLGLLNSAEKELIRANELGVKNTEAERLLSQVRLFQYKFEDILINFPSDKKEIQNKPPLQRVHYAIALLTQNEKEQALDVFKAVSDQESPTAHALSKAYISAINNDNSAAIGSATDALTISPDFWEAKILKAQLLANNEQFAESIELFKSITSRFPVDYVSQLNLAKAYLKNQNFTESLELASQLLKLFPDHPTLNQIKGTVSYNQDNLDTAKLHIEKAIQSGLRTSSNMLIAGLIHFKEKNYEQAYNYLKPIENELENNPAFKRLLTITELTLGYEKDAYDRLSSIDISSKEDEELLTKASLLFMQKGNKQAVKDNINKIADIQPTSSADNLNIGLLKLYADDFSGLINIEKALEQAPESTKTLTVLFGAYLEAEKFDDALALALKEIDKAPESAMNYNLARIAYAKLEQSKNAARMYQLALEKEPQNLAANLYFLNQSVADNKLNKAAEVALSILEHSPDHLYTLHTLFDVERKLDKQSEALKLIEQAYKRNENNEKYQLVYAKALFLTAKFDQLVLLLDKDDNQSLQSNNRILWGYLVNAYKLSSKIELAEQTANNWIREQSEDPFSWLYLIDVLDQQNKYTDALIKSNSAANRHADVPQFQVLKAYFTLFSGDIKSADKQYNSLANPSKELPLAKNLLGNLQAAKGNFTQAIPLLIESYELMRTSKIAQQVFLAYLNAKQQTDAIKFLDDHITRQPNDLKSRLLLANQLLNSEQKKAILHYEYVNQYSKSIVVLNNLSWLLLQDKDFIKAESYINEALGLAPNNVNILDTAASIAIAQQQTEKAKEYLSLALTQQPNNLKLKEKLRKLN